MDTINPKFFRIEFALSEEQAEKFQRIIMRDSMKKSYRQLSYGLLYFVIILLLGLFGIGTGNEPNLFLLILALFYLLYLGKFAWKLVKAKETNMEKLKRWNEKEEDSASIFEFQEDYLYVKDAILEVKLQWFLIQKIRVIDEILLIYTEIPGLIFTYLKR